MTDYHLPYPPGGGVQPMDGEVKLKPSLQKRIDLMVRVNDAIHRRDKRLMMELLDECKRNRHHASMKKLLEALK